MNEEIFKGRLLIRNIDTITRTMHDLYDEEYSNYGFIKSRDAVLRSRGSTGSYSRPFSV